MTTTPLVQRMAELGEQLAASGATSIVDWDWLTDQDRADRFGHCRSCGTPYGHRVTATLGADGNLLAAYEIVCPACGGRLYELSR